MHLQGVLSMMGHCLLKNLCALHAGDTAEQCSASVPVSNTQPEPAAAPQHEAGWQKARFGMAGEYRMLA